MLASLFILLFTFSPACEELELDYCWTINILSFDSVVMNFMLVVFGFLVIYWVIKFVVTIVVGG